MKALGTLLKALSIITRDLFAGLLMGICGTALLAKIYPHTVSVAGLLIPIGMASGVMKGMTKFMIMNYFSAIPSKGYRFYYPKYRLLLFWGGIWLITMAAVYGFAPGLWFQDPLKLIADNSFMGPIGKELLRKLFWLTLAAGFLAYFVEPPYNEDEFLPEISDLNK